MKNTIMWFLTILMMIVTPAVNFAQNDQIETVSYSVEHKHAIGTGKGELHITKEGIEYRGISKEEALHGSSWLDADIKRLEINKKDLCIIVYEAARIPIIPRKTPFTQGRGKNIKVGTEHRYLFQLQDGEVTEDMVSWLLARFHCPILTSIIPEKSRTAAELLFELPVFHRQIRGGEAGMLHVYKQFIIFDTEVAGFARYWRYPDIRDMAKLGEYRLELATYEGQLATEGKSYIFDLKRLMTDKEYDLLWSAIYTSR